MRHRKARLKLNRTSSHRKAMFRNMVTSLFKHERIRTTDVKAKELRRWADNLITLAKRGDLHARRQALSIVREKDVVYKLFEEASEKYGNVSGGYTRIVKMGRRPGDAAPISLVELISVEKSKKKKTKRKKRTKAAAEKKQVVEKKEVKAEKEEDKAEEKTATLAPGDAVQDLDVTSEEQATASDITETTENDDADTAESESKKEDTRPEK